MSPAPAAEGTSIASMMLPILDKQVPYTRGAVLAAEACAYAVLADEIIAKSEPSDELVGLRWALEEARHAIDALKDDLQAVLDRAREAAATG